MFYFFQLLNSWSTLVSLLESKLESETVTQLANTSKRSSSHPVYEIVPAFTANRKNQPLAHGSRTPRADLYCQSETLSCGSFVQSSQLTTGTRRRTSRLLCTLCPLASGARLWAQISSSAGKRGRMYGSRSKKGRKLTFLSQTIDIRGEDLPGNDVVSYILSLLRFSFSRGVQLDLAS